MFARSTSSTDIGSGDASDHSSKTGSSGLLQGLRKRTLLRMSRSSSVSSTSLDLSPTATTASPSTSSPWIEKQAILDARTRYFLVLMKRFQEQDCSLRQLEAELGDMLTQIQNACFAMTRAVEVFTQTFRYDAASYKLGVDYLAVMKTIACDGVEMMEQSIRFTVLDPILARLERHEQLKRRIHGWEQLYNDVVEQQLALEQLTSSGKDERRRRAEQHRLAEMQEQLAALQDDVTPRIEETTDTYPAESQVQLFSAMRLQLALFFYNTNQSLVGGLSETECEIVRGPTQQPSSPSLLSSSAPVVKSIEPPASALSEPSGASSISTVHSTANDAVRDDRGSVPRTHEHVVTRNDDTTKTMEDAVDLDAADSSSDADDLMRVSMTSSSSITLEEFELGKSPPDALDDDESVLDSELAHTTQSLSYSNSATAASYADDIVNLLALASHPVLPDFAFEAPASPDRYADHQQRQSEAEQLDDDASDAAAQQQQQLVDPYRGSVGAFSTLKRSFQDKFRVGSVDALPLRDASASPTSSVRASDTVFLPSPPSLSPIEWRQIERCLWEMDRTGAPSPPKRMLPPAATAVSPLPRTAWNAARSARIAGASVIHSLIELDKPLFFECTSFLALDDIARLAKVDCVLRVTLRRCASVWKQCIRTSSVAPAIRSAVWLAMLYGDTPWMSSTTAPHHLSSADTRAKIYEQLLVKVGTRMASGSLHAHDSASPASSSNSEENEHMRAWLHEIDVDVARTCSKDIYANDVADDWNADISAQQQGAAASSDVSNTSVDHATIEALVEAALFASTTETESQSESELLQSAESVLLDSTAATDSPSTLQPSRESQLAPDCDDAVASAHIAVAAKIRRVLRAYAMYNPRVGYCQGMNFLVRVLLEVTTNEADVFWLFVGLSEPEINRNLYEPGLAMLEPLLAKFELLVSYHMPELYVHFQREGVHVAAFSTRWFMTLFASFETFGPAMVLRVLDLFVIDGWRALLSMGLVVLDELRGVLVGAELEDILRILQSPRSYLVEPDHARRRQLVRHALAFCVTRAINTL